MGHARKLIEGLVAEASQCCAQVRGGSVCTRSAVAWRNGQPYCYAHDPDRGHLSMPHAGDRRRRVRWTAEGVLSEIALAPAFGGATGPAEDRDGPVDVAQGAEWEQEQMWWRIAKDAGLDEQDFKATAKSYGYFPPVSAKDVVDNAFSLAEEGKFPKRGWSAELVWLFLTLRDKGFVDAEGNSNVD